MSDNLSPDLKRTRRNGDDYEASRQQRPTGDRLPPHSIEAEQGVLGGIMLAPAENLGVAVEKFKAGASVFYDLRHQEIFKAMVELGEGEKSGNAVERVPTVLFDVTTLAQKLRDQEKLEDVGGFAFLMSLSDKAGFGAEIGPYLKIVWDKYLLRRLLTICSVTTGKIYENEDRDVSKFFAELEENIAGVCEPLQSRSERHIRDVIQEEVIPLVEKHYTRGSQQLIGLPTGLSYLDKVIGGVDEAAYMVLAGRPGDGKTSFALNMVEHLATKYVWFKPTGERDEEGKDKFERNVGVPVAIFTLEMTERALGYRMLFSHAKMSSARFKQGFANSADFQKLTVATASLIKANIYLDSDPDQSIDMIAAKARRMARQYGIKLFVLDYLQLVEGEDFNAQRNETLRRISKKIMSLKKKLKVPWLVLAQMNRNIETSEVKRPPQMSDLKDCGAIEQDADIITFLYSPLKNEHREEDEDLLEQYYDTAGPGEKSVPWDERGRRVNALVCKNREGATGKAELLFQKNQCQFLDWREFKVTHRLEDAAKGERYKDKGELPTNEEMGL